MFPRDRPGAKFTPFVTTGATLTGVKLGLDISAFTSELCKLSGCLKAMRGGLGKTLDSVEFFSTEGPVLTNDIAAVFGTRVVC